MPTLTEGSAEALIIQYVADNLPSEVNLSDVKFPNAKGTKSPDSNFCNLEVQWAPSLPAMAGLKALYRTRGFLIVDVNVPKGSGDIDITSIIDKLIALFRNNVTFRQLGFVFEGSQIDPQDERDKLDYYTKILNIYFYIESY